MAPTLCIVPGISGHTLSGEKSPAEEQQEFSWQKHKHKELWLAQIILSQSKKEMDGSSIKILPILPICKHGSLLKRWWSNILYALQGANKSVDF